MRLTLMFSMVALPSGAEWLIIAIILGVPILIGIFLVVLVRSNRPRA